MHPQIFICMHLLNDIFTWTHSSAFFVSFSVSLQFLSDLVFLHLHHQNFPHCRNQKYFPEDIKSLPLFLNFFLTKSLWLYFVMWLMCWWGNPQFRSPICLYLVLVVEGMQIWGKPEWCALQTKARKQILDHEVHGTPTVLILPIPNLILSINTSVNRTDQYICYCRMHVHSDQFVSSKNSHNKYFCYLKLKAVSSFNMHVCDQVIHRE